MKKIIHKILKLLGYTIAKISKENKYHAEQKWKFLKDIGIKTIIDIGANEGQFIAEILTIFPDSEIYSFEPLEDCYKKLNSTFKNSKKVHTYNLALGEQDGEIVFSRSSASPSSSILRMNNLHKKLFPHTAGSSQQFVKIMRLDDVLKESVLQNIILMKIDVQGTEDKVIQGALNIIEKTSIIITEVSYAALYEKQPLFKDIFTLLIKQKFIYIGVLEQFKNPLTDAPLFADAIFVKEDVYNKLYNS